MMKTLCVAVVVLSLTSVCKPAPLACEQLLKKADKSPDLSGTWYLIAVSSDVCLVPALFNAIFWPSIAMDITPKDAPKIYNAKFKLKMYGYCDDDSEPFLFENNTLTDVDSNNAPTSEPDVILQSGCPDCIVLQEKDVIDTFLLFSRRQTVTAEEQKEFEKQAECLGWSKPQVLNTDHDYDNCKTLDDDSDFDVSEVSNMMYQRLKDSYTLPLSCITEDIVSFPNAVSEWFQQTWS